MSFVNKEQIHRAKEVDVVDYVLKHESNNVRRSGEDFRLIDHPSISISDDGWYWHSQSTGSKSALDFLITVRGYTFREAVLKLMNERSWDHAVIPTIFQANQYTAKIACDAPINRKPLQLPPRNVNNSRVIAYLKSRGIEREDIIACISSKIIYESKKYSNCVFVGMDDDGVPRYATLRSIFSSFKCDVKGSDKSFGFLLPAAEETSNTVAVFESAIDSLSHQTMCKQGFIPEFNGWRLSLGCTAPTALKGFLERKGNVTHCQICTDNDAAGELAAKRIMAAVDIRVERSLPCIGKDWNECLLAQQKTKRLENRTVHSAERS